MKIKFIKKVQIAKDTYSLHFEKPVDYSYRAGQYVVLTLKADDKTDSRGNERPFTLSSSPTEPDLVITTRFIQTKSSSFKKTLFALKPGNFIDVSDPKGEFTLPETRQPIVWIAGGIGITPYRSQLKFMIDTKLDYPIYLIYSCSTIDDVSFNDVLQSAQSSMNKFKLVTTLSESAPNDWKGERGLISDIMLSNAIDALPESQVYVSGPEYMVDILTQRLTKLGVLKNNIHHDWFSGYTDKF